MQPELLYEQPIALSTNKNIAIMISQTKLLDTVKSEHKNLNEFRQEVSDDFQP
jgi:hypothetical protein